MSLKGGSTACNVSLSFTILHLMIILLRLAKRVIVSCPYRHRTCDKCSDSPQTNNSKVFFSLILSLSLSLYLNWRHTVISWLGGILFYFCMPPKTSEDLTAAVAVVLRVCKCLFVCVCMPNTTMMVVSVQWLRISFGSGAKYKMWSTRGDTGNTSFIVYRYVLVLLDSIHALHAVSNCIVSFSENPKKLLVHVLRCVV